MACPACRKRKSNNHQTKQHEGRNAYECVRSSAGNWGEAGAARTAGRRGRGWGEARSEAGEAWEGKERRRREGGGGGRVVQVVRVGRGREEREGSGRCSGFGERITQNGGTSVLVSRYHQNGDTRLFFVRGTTKHGGNTMPFYCKVPPKWLSRAVCSEVPPKWGSRRLCTDVPPKWVIQRRGGKIPNTKKIHPLSFSFGNSCCRLYPLHQNVRKKFGAGGSVPGGFCNWRRKVRVGSPLRVGRAKRFAKKTIHRYQFHSAIFAQTACVCVSCIFSAVQFFRLLRLSACKRLMPLHARRDGGRLHSRRGSH